MKSFARLYYALDATNKTNEKISILADYFLSADPVDLPYALGIFTGRRPKRQVTLTQLRLWAAELAGVPDWLFDASYHVVGDLAETIALILKDGDGGIDLSLGEMYESLRDLKGQEEREKKAFIMNAWRRMDSRERLVFNKLITGAFRVGVSRQTVVRGLEKAFDIEAAAISHRLMGEWMPGDITFEKLVLEPDAHEDSSKPFPFYLAYALEQAPHELGEPAAWQAEWKWDGIRGQIVVRAGQVWVWSRGEELVTEEFPEFQALAESVPDGTVIDGEILPVKNGMPMPFNQLQKRLGRKKVSKKMLKEIPVCLFAYDLLEWEGEDIRQKPLRERRQLLEQVVEEAGMPGVLNISNVIDFDDWSRLKETRAESRAQQAEGLMLKQLDSHYRTGRKKGDWWKWKVDPLTADAVLIYANRGSGRRANLYTDYTFGVWTDEGLVPFAKAYSGLTDAEINTVDKWIRENTLEKFGPVRTVKPELVFEIAFEGIRESARHKSGIAVRFPRILRWRTDKSADEADRLENVKALLIRNR